jgi:hypothetical protein
MYDQQTGQRETLKMTKHTLSKEYKHGTACNEKRTNPVEISSAHATGAAPCIISPVVTQQHVTG